MAQQVLVEYKTDVLDAHARHLFTVPINIESHTSNKPIREPRSFESSQISHTKHNPPFKMLRTIVIPLAFASVTFATVMPIGYCPQPTTTYTASAAPFYYGAPVLDTSVATCNSTDTTTCALGVSASTSAGYTITMGAGLTLDL